ncbi:MAG: hypothetical protein ABEI98_10450, partial [Halorhabdus sp.]
MTGRTVRARYNARIGHLFHRDCSGTVKRNAESRYRVFVNSDVQFRGMDADLKRYLNAVVILLSLNIGFQATALWL